MALMDQTMMPLFPNAHGPFFMKHHHNPTIYPLDIHRPHWEGMEAVRMGVDKFVVQLDVHVFSPDELLVKTTDDFTLVIRGHHEDKEDKFGTITRDFTRKYTLPKNADMEGINCEISSDGVLQVTIPLIVLMKEDEGKEHKIYLTGAPHTWVDRFKKTFHIH